MQKVQTISPVDGQLIREYTTESTQALSAKIAAMQTAFSLWHIKPVEARAAYLENLVDLLQTQQVNLATLITTEMGKPLEQSLQEINKCIYLCEYYLDICTEVLCDEYIDQYHVTYQPLGVILGIMPWNFPFWQVFRFIIPTLLAGNVCIIKHSENVTGCALAIKDLFRFANFDDHLLDVAVCDVKQTQKMITNPLVKAISLTGSREAGIAVAKTAASVLKPCLLELGGNDGYYVHDDIPQLRTTCQRLINARLQNAGQSCISPKRILVHNAIFNQFKQEFLAQLENLPAPGDPMQNRVNVGPIARKDLLEKLEVQVQKLIGLGAKVLFESDAPNTGFFFPIIVLELSNDIHFDEELFGPVFCLIPAENKEQAIRMLNASNYGLGSGLFMKDPLEAHEIAKYHLDSGLSGINRCVSSTPSLPFGGIKESGYGRELGPNALLNFCNTKVIIHEDTIT